MLAMALVKTLHSPDGINDMLSIVELVELNIFSSVVTLVRYVYMGVGVSTLLGKTKKYV